MRISVAVAVACLSITSLCAAEYAAAAIRQETNIPAQSLGSALEMFASNRSLQLVYATDEVNSLHSAGASGNLNADEALRQLLQGTGLSYQFLDAKTVTVQPSAPASSSMHSPGSKVSEETLERAGARRDANSAENLEKDSKGLWQRFRLALASESSDSSSASSSSTEASAEASENELEEIVVTAQKRKERLQDVPISISVLSGDQLDSFTGKGVNEALIHVPGIKMTQTYWGGNTQIAMRGVSASGPVFEGSSPVAYYLDSVPFGFVKSAIAPDADVFDLERVEALRGPQGTLYGANALNGVVRVLTHDANLDEFELKTRASISTVEEGGEGYRADLAVNMPIVPGKLAARVVAGYDKTDGWIDNLVREDIDDAKLRNLRFKLNAQPTEQLSVGLMGWFSRADYGAAPISEDDDFYPGTGPQPMGTDYDVFGLRIGYEFEKFSIASMTSHIDFSNFGIEDLTPFVLLGLFDPEVQSDYFDSKVFSQEVLLSSTGEGSWRWSAGGYYRDAEDRLVQIADFFLADVDFGDLSESFAIFGELTRVFLDGRLDLTGGLRYFEDEVTQVENRPYDGDTSRPLFRGRSKFDALSPRVVLNWHLTDRSTVYGSYSEGFRSGFNQNPNIKLEAPGFPPASEDTLKNYEVGAKGYLAVGMLSYDASVYYIDWQDVQQTVYIAIPPGSQFTFTGVLNGESASGLGADLALIARPIQDLELSINVSWNDLAIDGPVTASTASGDVLLFSKGDRLNYSAEYTAGASAEYRFPIGSTGFEGRLAASASYSSEQTYRKLSGTNLVVNRGDEMLLGRTSFSFGPPDSWTATLFIDNFNDERSSPMRDVDFPFLSTRIRPRTMGLQLEYRY